MSYLTKMTVKALKTLAGEMKIKGRSSMDKTSLVGAIGTVINMDHDEALEINTPRLADTWEIEHSASVDAYDMERQIKDWWMRHGLDLLETITAEDIIAARAKDHVAALAHDYLKNVLTRHARKLQGYVNQNNGRNALTPRQARRAERKMNRASNTYTKMVNA
jgi:hypothetical protein